MRAAVRLQSSETKIPLLTVLLNWSENSHPRSAVTDEEASYSSTGTTATDYLLTSCQSHPSSDSHSPHRQ